MSWQVGCREGASWMRNLAEGHQSRCVRRVGLILEVHYGYPGMQWFESGCNGVYLHDRNVETSERAFVVWIANAGRRREQMRLFVSVMYICMTDSQAKTVLVLYFSLCFLALIPHASLYDSRPSSTLVRLLTQLQSWKHISPATVLWSRGQRGAYKCNRDSHSHLSLN